MVSSCACFNLRKASRVFTQHFDEALKPTGLLITQFSILAAIASVRSGTINELAAGLVMDRTTLTRNLKPLEREGWIQIEAGQDQRERVVNLTQAGQALLAQAFPLWQQAQAQVIAALGQQDWQQLLKGVTKTVSALKES
ncbi:MAG: MarR family winged helix-turn-helix transcriptional regulator [Thermosynechococcaceae cyanobacterium]